MRLVLASARWFAPLLLLTASLGAFSGCTTEAACFDDCHGIPGNQGGSASGGSPSLGGSVTIGFGGDSETGTAGSLNVGGGKLEDAGKPCDGVDLQTDVNNC